MQRKHMTSKNLKTLTLDLSNVLDSSIVDLNFPERIFEHLLLGD